MPGILTFNACPAVEMLQQHGCGPVKCLCCKAFHVRQALRNLQVGMITDDDADAGCGGDVEFSINKH